MVIPSKKINSLKSLYKTDSCNLDFTMQTCLILEKLQWPNYIAGVFSHFMAELKEKLLLAKTCFWERSTQTEPDRLPSQPPAQNFKCSPRTLPLPPPLLPSSPFPLPDKPKSVYMARWQVVTKRCGRLYYKNIGCLGISELHCLVFLTVGSFVCVEMFSLGFVTSTSRYI